MSEVCEAPPMGHNNPPPPTPYEAFSEHISDLILEARNFLDGAAIETEEQATAVSRILDGARKAKRDADAQRKLEAKPFDDGKAEVQARWNPLLVQADLAANVAKEALAPWLVKVDEANRAAEAALQAEADALKHKAQEARQSAVGNLEARDTAERLLKAAGDAQKDAARAGKAKAHARGGERAVGLVDVFTPVLTDACAALRFYREREPDALKEWLVEQARKDVRAGIRSIVGFEIEHTRTAR